jgi:hypothetical protein
LNPEEMKRLEGYNNFCFESRRDEIIIASDYSLSEPRRGEIIFETLRFKRYMTNFIIISPLRGSPL